MSDPAKTAEEIEDVLASIRRLVSDQGAGGAGNSAASSGQSSGPPKVPALVLAPSFRVAEPDESATDESDREADWHPDDRLAHYDSVGADAVDQDTPGASDPLHPADRDDIDASEEDLADLMLLDGALRADTDEAAPETGLDLLSETSPGDFESDTGDENWPGDGAEAALLSLVARRDPALSDLAAEQDRSGDDVPADEAPDEAPTDMAAPDPGPMDRASNGETDLNQFEPEDVPNPHAEADMSWILDPASVPDLVADTDPAGRDQVDTSAMNTGPAGKAGSDATGNLHMGSDPDALDAAAANADKSDWAGPEDDDRRDMGAGQPDAGVVNATEMWPEDAPDHADNVGDTPKNASVDDAETDADEGVPAPEAQDVDGGALEESFKGLKSETDIETAMAGVFAVPPPPIFSRRAQAETCAVGSRAPAAQGPTEADSADVDPPPDLGAFVGADRTGTHEESGASGISKPDDGILDEDTLRDIIADVVREELRGVLGQRITRNVRKMVRREIRLALAAEELD